MGLELIIAIGAVGFLLSYLFFKTDKDNSKAHLLLRLLLLGCLFGVFVLLGKAGLDSANNCDLVINRTVDLDDGLGNHNVSYFYDTVCYSNTEANTSLTFYNLTLWIVRLISVYLLVYFFYELFIWISDMIRGQRGRSTSKKRRGGK